MDLGHGDARHLPNHGDDEVHGGADGGEEVERHERVHPVLGRAEQALDQGEAEGLEDDAQQLEDEADQDEFYLADGRDDDADHNHGHVEERPEARLGDAHGPARQQHGDRGGGLEHLDEGDAQVQVRQVAEDEARAEQEADGHDGAQVDLARHLDRLAAI